MQATNLKTNHLSAPLGMDAGTLFLSWQCAGGVRQTAYEIEVTAGAGTPRYSKEILAKFQQKCGATICREVKGVGTGKVLCECPECVRNAVLALGEVMGIE